VLRKTFFCELDVVDRLVNRTYIPLNKTIVQMCRSMATS